MRRRQHSWVILIAALSSMCGGRRIRRGTGRILLAAVRVLFSHGNPSNLISALQQLKGNAFMLIQLYLSKYSCHISIQIDIQILHISLHSF